MEKRATFLGTGRLEIKRDTSDEGSAKRVCLGWSWSWAGIAPNKDSVYRIVRDLQNCLSRMKDKSNSPRLQMLGLSTMKHRVQQPSTCVQLMIAGIARSWKLLIQTKDDLFADDK